MTPSVFTVTSDPLLSVEAVQQFRVRVLPFAQPHEPTIYHLLLKYLPWHLARIHPRSKRRPQRPLNLPSLLQLLCPHLPAPASSLPVRNSGPPHRRHDLHEREVANSGWRGRGEDFPRRSSRV